MISIWEIPFIVIDVETTGSDPKRNRIIDIAAITSLGGKVIEQYHSLVNPHQMVPAFISDMTGISNEMVYIAPDPYEVFPKVDKILRKENAVFVAHNARFDYSFLESSFQLNGIPFPKIEKLCTLKLAKRVVPNLQKKNVGALASYFGIPVKGRHRAYGDALATAGILNNLLEIAYQEHNINTLEELLSFQNEPMHKFKAPLKSFKFIKDTLDAIPEEPGVYYFKDENENILYIGKAKFLKDRVKTYYALDNPHSRKITEMIKRIRKIEWTTTDTELGALLLETKEIKKHKPPYNTLDKVYRNYPFIKLTTNDLFPKIIPTFELKDDGSEYYGPFKSLALVEETILQIEKQFKIIKCDLNIDSKTKVEPCFYFHIKQCDAPCNGRVTPEQYNLEINKVRNYLSGYPDGVIDRLTNKMYEFSDKMDFELAARIRNQIKELRKVIERQRLVPTSINKNNLILIVPSSIKSINAEIFFIRSGKLKLQKTLGDLDLIEDLYDAVKTTFFNNENISEFPYSQEDIKEMKIISSWAFSVKDYAAFIYIEGKTENEVISEFTESYYKIINGEVLENNDY